MSPFVSMVERSLSAIIAVLERQYKRYFDIDLTDQLRKETQSARCHYIDPEELMGMFSAAKEHAPNATLQRGIKRKRSAKIKEEISKRMAAKQQKKQTFNRNKVESKL